MKWVLIIVGAALVGLAVLAAKMYARSLSS